MRKQGLLAIWACTIVLFSFVASLNFAGQKVVDDQTTLETLPHSADNSWYCLGIGNYAIETTGVELRAASDASAAGNLFVAAGSLGLLHYTVSSGDGISLSTTKSTGGCTRDVVVLRAATYAVDSISGTLHTFKSDYYDYQCAIPGGLPVCVAAGDDGYCYVGTLAATGYNFYVVYVGTPENPSTTPYIRAGCRISGNPRTISINPGNRQAIIAMSDTNCMSVVDISTPSTPVEIATYGFEAPIREATVLMTAYGNILGIACGSKLYARDLNNYASTLWSVDFGWEVRTICKPGNTGDFWNIIVITQLEICSLFVENGGINNRGPVVSNVHDCAAYYATYNEPFMDRIFVVGGSGGYDYIGTYKTDLGASDPFSISAPARGSTYSAPPVFSVTADLSIASGGMWVTVGTNTNKFWFAQVGTTSEFRLDANYGDWVGWCTNWNSVVPDGVVDLTITCQTAAWPNYKKSMTIAIGKDTVPPVVSITTPIDTPRPVFGPSTGAPIVIANMDDEGIIDSSVKCSVKFASTELFSMYRSNQNEYTFDSASPEWDIWSAMWLDPMGFDTGAYVIKVEVSDRAGNLGSDETEIYWDITPPWISVITPDFTQGTLVYGASVSTPNFHISVFDPDIDVNSVEMIISSESLSESFSLAADPEPELPYGYSLKNGFGEYGAWADFWQGLWPGFYSITFSATDIVGNIASEDDVIPQQMNIIVDLSGPIITIYEPVEETYFSNIPPAFSLFLEDTDSGVNYLYYSFDSEPIWGQGNWYSIGIPDPGSSVSVQGVLNAGWESCAQGPVLVTFMPFDYGLNSWQRSITIYKDTIKPVFQILYPQSDVSVFEGPLTYSLDITELNLLSIWASNDGWETPYQLSTSSGTLPSDLWPSDLPYGSMHIDFKVVDKSGNEEFDGVDFFMIDSTPVITINEPLTSEEKCYGPLAPIYDLTIINWEVLGNLWVSIDDGVTKFALSSEQGQLPQDLWANCLLGVNTILFHGESLYGHAGEASIEIEVDNRGPEITIVQPQNGNRIGATPPMYVLRVTDEHLDYIYITFDGGQTKIDVPTDALSGTIPEYAWDAAYAKTVLFEVFAVDIFGNVNSVSITITRTDWIRPDSGSHDARGDDIGFGLFFYMPMEAMIYLGVVFSIALLILVMFHRRSERAGRDFEA